MPISRARQTTASVITAFGSLSLLGGGSLAFWALSLWQLMNEPCPPDEELCEMSPGLPVAFFGSAAVAVVLLATGFVLVVAGLALFRSGDRPAVAEQQRW
jgi:hypothetical protein